MLPSFGFVNVPFLAIAIVPAVALEIDILLPTALPDAVALEAVKLLTLNACSLLAPADVEISANTSIAIELFAGILMSKFEKIASLVEDVG